MELERCWQAACAEAGCTGWQLFFEQESRKPYFRELDAFVSKAMESGTVYPPEKMIFRAFCVPPQAVRVVILGQDPYHAPGQAMGLAFSVPQGTKAPPSLRNIQKELDTDIGPGAGAGTDLTPWAKQGVFLLNTVLTVEDGAAFSHAGKGWETFTGNALKYLAQQGDGPLATVLWGKPAQKYEPLLTAAAGRRPVLVLKSAHPSPLSAYRGFFGSRPFSQVNDFLQKHGVPPLDWTLNETTSPGGHIA